MKLTIRIIGEESLHGWPPVDVEMGRFEGEADPDELYGHIRELIWHHYNDWLNDEEDA